MRGTLAALLLSVALCPRPALAQERMVVAGWEGTMLTRAGLAVVGEAYQRVGLQLEFLPFDGPGSLAAVNRGEADADLSRALGLPDGLGNLVRVPVPIGAYRVVAVAKDPTLRIDGWASLTDMRAGLLSSVIHVRENVRGDDAVLLDSYSEMYARLIAGEVDVIVVPESQARLRIAEAPDEGLVILPGLLQTMLLYHFVHARHEALVPELTATLKAMLLAGDTQRLREDAMLAALGEAGR